MPPHDSRPLWGAALALSLVAVPALASFAAPAPEVPAASLSTLTLGWGESGFGWSAGDTAPEAAAGSPRDLTAGAASVRVVPQEDGDTEQPYPLALRGITAHPVSGSGAIGAALDVAPALVVEEVASAALPAADSSDTDADSGSGSEADYGVGSASSSPVLRRLAGLGLAHGGGGAFDVDHAIDTRWSFRLPQEPGEIVPAQADASGGIVYCVAVASGAVRSAGDGTARGTGLEAVLTFRGAEQELPPDPTPDPTIPAPDPTVPAPDPTVPAPTPTTLPTEPPAPDPTAGPTDEPTADPSVDPTVPPTVDPQAPTEDAPVPAPTFTAGPPTVEPDEATTCADVPGAGAAGRGSAEVPDFTHGSAQDAIATRIDDDGEAYFEVPAPPIALPAADDPADEPGAEVPVARELTGPGLDLGGAAPAAHSLGFRLTATPQDGAVTYSNHTENGAFADRGHARQEMLLEQAAPIEHRWGPTRDAHARWSFTRPGVYCLAYAVDGPRTDGGDAQRAGSTQELAPDDVLRFVVGEADPLSVDCAEESEGTTIPFPREDGPGDGSDDGDDSDDDGSEDGSDDSGDGSDSDEDSDDEPGGLGGGPDGNSDDGEDGGVDGRPGADESDESDEEKARTRVVAAPASAAVCPADRQAARQVRSGGVVLQMDGDGMRMTDVATGAAVADGSTIVVGDTARRTAAAGIDGFVAPGGQYLATGSAGAPTVTWSAAGIDEAVELEVQQTAGDGQVRVFLGDGAGVPADGGTLAVEPDSAGTLLFGFDQPGEYAVTLRAGSGAGGDGDSGGGREVELRFAAGDRFASAQPGTVVRTLLSACPDVSWETDLLSAEAPGELESEAAEDDTQAQQPASSVLGRGWWGAAYGGMALAGLLMIAILVVVVRESRR